MPVNATNNKLGMKASNFNLLSVDDKFYTLKDLIGEKGTVVAFLCNHCPYVIRMAERFSYEANELKKIGIATLAIMSNDVKSYPDDSFKKMKIFAKKYQFNFPYLYDSTQSVARNFGAICTPDIFGFNKDLILEYRGRINSDVTINQNKDIKRELFYAMELIAKTNHGPKKQFNSFGCSIKWLKDE